MTTFNNLQTAKKRLEQAYEANRGTVDFWHQEIRKLQSQQYQAVERASPEEKNKIKQQWQLRIDGARKNRDQRFKESEEQIKTRKLELAEIENEHTPQARQFAQDLEQGTAPIKKPNIIESQVPSGIISPARTKKRTKADIPLIGQEPKNLPPLKKILTPEQARLRPGIKDEIFLPRGVPTGTPPIALPKSAVTRIANIGRRRTIEQQTTGQQQISQSASRIQQIANYGPIRGALHRLGAVTGFNQAKVYVTHKISQGVKKGLKFIGKKAAQLAVKAATKLGARGLIYAAGALSGLATGGIGTALTIGLAVADVGLALLKKFKKVALAAMLYLMYWLSWLLHSLFVLAFTVAGAALDFMIAGPLGALIGGTAGNIFGRWLYNWWNNPGGSGAALTNSLYGSPKYVINPITGETVIANTGGPVDILTGGGIGSTIVPATMVGTPMAVTFGMAAFGTFFVAMHLMTSFTVPNPIGTKSPSIIYGPGNQPVPLPDPLDPVSAALNAAIAAAAQANCVPGALIKAIMQSESAAYGWSDTEYQNFSTPDWWTHATVTRGGSTQTVNCYNGHYTARNGYQSSQCQAGYCYDTCTETGICGGTKTYYCAYDQNLNCGDPANVGHPNCNQRCKNYTYPPIQGATLPYSRAVLEALPANASCAGLSGKVCSSFAVGAENKQICPFDRDGSGTNSNAVCTDYDVYGATQFERETFYGLNCRYRDGSNTSCYQKNQGRNRCNAADVVTATAEKLSAAASAAPNCGGGTTPSWTVDQICSAAKNYCGSCGQVQNPNHPLYSTSNPCYAIYDPVDPSTPMNWISGACGGSTGEGYCDKVAKLYFGSGQ
jgi:hypothetical protein